MDMKMADRIAKNATELLKVYEITEEEQILLTLMACYMEHFPLYPIVPKGTFLKVVKAYGALLDIVADEVKSQIAKEKK
jgi:hypothetical protein